MPWISVHQEVDGTKLRRLYRAIGCSKFEALGILNFLWFWGMKNADETGLVGDDFDEDPVSHACMTDERFDSSDFHDGGFDVPCDR